MDNLSIELLKLFSKRHSLSICDIAIILDTDPLSVVGPPVAELHSQGFLSVCMLDQEKCENGLAIDAKLQITQLGKNKLYDLEQEAKRDKYKSLIDWIHIGLTVVAVAISIIALLKP